MYGWLKASLKSTETRDELSTTYNPKVMSRCLSEPDATSLHHGLKNKQLKLILWLALTNVVDFNIAHTHTMEENETN